MKSICVYLGAKPSNNLKFRNAVVLLGKQIADADLCLIYGGSGSGLMGLLAKTVQQYGGKVTGITMPHLIEQEPPLISLEELLIVETIQERKLLMQQKADAFLVMPGGIGTLDEAFETWDAIKIGLLKKPLGFLNIDGYFDALFAFTAHALAAGFISEAQAKIPKINEDSGKLLAELLGKHPAAAAV